MADRRDPQGRLDDARRQVRKMMELEGLCSLMNDTKWRELCFAMMRLRPLPKFRIRDMLGLPGYVSEWDREWYYHPGPYFSIHWMEIDPGHPPASENVTNALDRLGIPYEQAGGLIRVYGYTQPARAAKPLGRSKD